ncbi:MAG: fused MFS/spermidine synthase [Aureliella sp.]
MRTSENTSRGLATLYAMVVFLSAFLLFQVQPLIGKCILPWFGGTPAVWTTCMLVFQLLLFGGYAYAHMTAKFLSPRGQAGLHTGLLIAALCTLPIIPDASWKPMGDDAPALRIVLLLVATIGLPYFVLSSTSPLIQSWFSRTHAGQSPYRLYSLSNVGSLLALLSYPFLVEPCLATDSQASLWSWIFATFAALCTWCAVRMFGGAAMQSLAPPQIHDIRATRPSWGLTLQWFGLAMTASILLLATTNQVCLDVAVVPFLWVLPLALYLLTFILCFESERWYSRRIYTSVSAVLLLAAVNMIGFGSHVSILLQIAIFFGMMFSCCMVCHGELAAIKPHPRFLTAYFLTMSAGGAAGGLFVGLLAPILFVSYNEFYFGIFCFMFLFITLRLREDNFHWPLPNWTCPLAVAGLMLLVLGLLVQAGRHTPGNIAVSRNFYGVLRVLTANEPQSHEPMLQMAHGRITHGSQFLAQDKKHIPTAYYAKSTGIGKLLGRIDDNRPRHIGVVGLGIGTLAAYGRPGDRLRMYEINPQVIELAREHFSFLRDCAADQSIITGDARLSLEFEPPQHFDVLVLDAFSGDAIPVHLLTSEALQVYFKHLKPNGILACHISNLHFNLKPVVAGLAAEHRLSVSFHRNTPDARTAALAASWAMIARTPECLAQTIPSEAETPPVGRPIVWTDNRSNLLEVMW